MHMQVSAPAVVTLHKNVVLSVPWVLMALIMSIGMVVSYCPSLIHTRWSQQALTFKRNATPHGYHRSLVSHINLTTSLHHLRTSSGWLIVDQKLPCFEVITYLCVQKYECMCGSRRNHLQERMFSSLIPMLSVTRI